MSKNCEKLNTDAKTDLQVASVLQQTVQNPQNSLYLHYKRQEKAANPSEDRAANV